MAERTLHRRDRHGGAHDERSVVGPGCDDQFEFEFALDLLLDGFERLTGRAGVPPANPDGDERHPALSSPSQDIAAAATTSTFFFSEWSPGTA